MRWSTRRGPATSHAKTPMSSVYSQDFEGREAVEYPLRQGCQEVVPDVAFFQGNNIYGAEVTHQIGITSCQAAQPTKPTNLTRVTSRASPPRDTLRFIGQRNNSRHPLQIALYTTIYGSRALRFDSNRALSTSSPENSWLHQSFGQDFLSQCTSRNPVYPPTSTVASP